MPYLTHCWRASARATNAPVMEAVRVPPSACTTSQSSVTVRSPNSAMSTTARNERPIRRWISCVRPEGRPLLTSRGVRFVVARGSMEYSSAPTDAGADVQVLRSLRRAMAQSMALSRDNVMACSVFDDADLHRWRSGSDYSARVLRAITIGLRAERGLNAWYDAASQSRTLFEHVAVGLAMDTPDGLMVPVIRHVEQLDALQLRAELNRLKRAARERTVKSEELRNFTFMLSNFGTMAGRYATPVVVPPAGAILGTGRGR